MAEQGELLALAGEAAGHFAGVGPVGRISPYGSGHINDTFLAEGRGSHILQRMNRSIFHDPDAVMENILGVTSFLRAKIEREGGDAARGTMTVVRTGDGKPIYRDGMGNCWRMYEKVEGASSHDRAESGQMFYESAVTFGKFCEMLSDYPAGTLHETIPGFHDTRARYASFLRAVEEDALGRAKGAEREIAFFRERRETAEVFGDLLSAGELPIRVTHNDTKLNNILMDDETGKGVCVIDLDTVMPGLILHDFGDAIRFGASTAAEDERDLSKVSCDLGLFRLYAEGFLGSCGRSLTKREIALLPMGAKVMTYECGIRFLQDYLEGDTYFKTRRAGQNLDRCRTQMKLVADMEEKWGQMQEIIADAAGKAGCAGMA